MENKETVFNTEIDKLIDNMDLTKEPPIKEPERQYWFMKKARQLVKEKETEIGRPLTACVTTFGCQMNARDSEKLAGILEASAMRGGQRERGFCHLQYLYGPGKRQSTVYGRLGHLNSLKRTTSGYDDRPVRLHDAGASDCGKAPKELLALWI